MNSTTPLILASGSPRRKELMSKGGWEFVLAPADIDENILPGEAPDRYVLRLAVGKARAAASRAPHGSLVIGADTTVVLTTKVLTTKVLTTKVDATKVDESGAGAQILGKPVDEAEAAAMLRQLRGQTHQVYSAVAVAQAGSSQIYSGLCITDVMMRNYNDEEIAAYIATRDPMDKAGAYAIQHETFHPAEGIRGCFANVVGLPVCLLAELLERFGMPGPAGVPRKCPDTAQYDCVVCEQMKP